MGSQRPYRDKDSEARPLRPFPSGSLISMPVCEPHLPLWIPVSVFALFSLLVVLLFVETPLFIW